MKKQTLDEMLVADAADKQARPDTLALITTAADELRRATAAENALAYQFETACAETKRLREAVLPPLMDEAGVKELSLDDGTRLVRTDEVYASVSKANLPKAAEWLEANGYGALVKSKITIEFERGDKKTADTATAVLTKAKIGFDNSFAINVATLKSFCKESLANGVKLPLSINVHEQATVTLKTPKVK